MVFDFSLNLLNAFYHTSVVMNRFDIFLMFFSLTLKIVKTCVFMGAFIHMKGNLELLFQINVDDVFL